MLTCLVVVGGKVGVPYGYTLRRFDENKGYRIIYNSADMFLAKRAEMVDVQLVPENGMFLASLAMLIA